MAATEWKTSKRGVAGLQLDPKNPRLGRETSARAPREIIQYLFDHDKAMEVAESIVLRGYFPNEPLLAVKEGDDLVVVEGNRRLAALKGLRDPGLLEGAARKKLERLARLIEDPASITSVPVTLAPTRRATDRLLAGRHIGTAVLPWQAENRASFILDKLSEGYSTDEIRDELGFTLSDIQTARQTRAIADMARSLDLPPEVKAKLDDPRTNIFTTLERVFDSSIGREYLRVEPDPEHGLRGLTTKSEFVRGFKRLVSDVARKRASSRTLNKSEDIENYFKSLDPDDLPKKKRGKFVPADIIAGPSVASVASKSTTTPAKGKTKRINKTVLPKDLKIRFGDDRLIDIRTELIALDRKKFPNAGAVLLRVFLELSIRHYLERTGRMPEIIATIEKKENRKLPFGTPSLKQLTPIITRIAKDKLSVGDATKVERAIKYDPAAPFSISELHGFVHHSDPPGEREVWQFWTRTEPLFRLMLELDEGESHA